MNFNKVFLSGHLTRDPESRKARTTDSTVVTFGLAVNETRKDLDGNRVETTHFVDCTAFGKTGERLVQFVKKGTALFVEGKLRYEAWEDKNGGKRSKLGVVVHDFRFVGPKPPTAPADGRRTPLTGRQMDLPVEHAHPVDAEEDVPV
jgi:single-strand DNA-binding protein